MGTERTFAKSSRVMELGDKFVLADSHGNYYKASDLPGIDRFFWFRSREDARRYLEERTR